jgi:steroid delta-isomerase-like uncharacterized protein
MKTPTVLALAALLGLAAGSAFSAPLSEKKQATVRQELTQVMKEYITACEHVDSAAATMKFAADVPEFRFADIDGKRYDYAGFKKSVTDFFAGLSAMKVTTRNQDILVLGPDTTLVIWHGAIDLIQKDGSVLRFDPYNVTFLFKRFGGTWKIVFQHESCLPPQPATAQTAVPGRPPGDVAAEIAKAFNRHDATALARLYAEDQVTVLPGSPEPVRGRKAKAEMVAGYFGAFPDLKLDIPLILISGEYAVCEGTMSGTNTGPMSSPEGNAPATGRRVILPISYILKVGPDGFVQTDHTYFDDASFQQQLAGPPSEQSAKVETATVPSSARATNEAVVREFYAAIDRNDFDKIKTLISDDFALMAPGLAKPWGFEELCQAVKHHYAAFPDWQHAIEDVVAEGDKVAVRILQTGTHQAQYEGIPATGTKVTMPAHGLLLVANGKIRAFWAAEDYLDLMQQLGMELKPRASKKDAAPATPPPGSAH